MSVPAGQPFHATLVDPGGLTAGVGARVEVPVTRQIVSYWRPATLTDAVWSATLDGVPSPGLYNLVWRAGVDPSPFEITQPLEVVAEAPAAQLTDFPDVDTTAVRPSVDEVAALERTRTVGAGSSDVGTFDETTSPTGGEVDGLIDEATDHVLIQLPDQFDVRHYGQVKRAIALQAASLIEQSYFQEAANEATVMRWEGMVVTILTALNTRIAVDLEDRYAGDGQLGAILA